MDTATLMQSLQSTLGQNIPHLLGAVAILVIGWFVAIGVRAAVRRGLGLVGLNRHFAKLTGQQIDLELALATAAFCVVLLLTLAGVFNTLDLGLLSNPFTALTTQLFEYAPRLIAGLVLALVAWLLASIVRAGINKALGATTLDEKLSEHAGMAPVSQTVGQALFGLSSCYFSLPS